MSASKQLLEGALRREFEILLSVALVLEYESVLMRPEHLHYASASASQIEGLIISLLSVAVKIELHDYFGPYSVDPNDNHILSLATHGRADAIVLHNTRHFATPAKASGVNLYIAREALHLLRR